MLVHGVTMECDVCGEIWQNETKEMENWTEHEVCESLY